MRNQSQKSPICSRGHWSDLYERRFPSQEGQELYRDILIENGSKDETSVYLSAAMRAKQLDTAKEQERKRKLIQPSGCGLGRTPRGSKIHSKSLTDVRLPRSCQRRRTERRREPALFLQKHFPTEQHKHICLSAYTAH